MGAVMKLIGGEDPLPKIVEQMVEYNKEVRKAFQFGPKFSIGSNTSEWNKFQHEIKISLPDQSGTAKRNTREGVFIQASKLAAQVFHDSAMAGPIAEMFTDVSAVTLFRPRAELRSAADAKVGPSQYLPQVVIALPGRVFMVSQVILGPDADQKGRARQG